MGAVENWSWWKKNYLVWKWLKPAAELTLLVLVLGLVFIAYGVVPNRWYQTLYIYSGSMSPTFNAGDIILITPPPAELNPGMIVTIQVDGHLVTHRIIEVRADGKFVTRGDANLWGDEWGEQARVKVVGLYRARIPYLGYIFGAIKNLIPVNSSGAWFVDQKQLKFQVSIGSPKETETSIPCANVAGVVTATPTFTPETLTQLPAQLPVATSLPTQAPTFAVTVTEAASPTETPEPISPEISPEVTPEPTLEPTVTEPPAAPTQLPAESGTEDTATESAPETTPEAPPEALQP